jgi:hypothetical protein
MMVEPMYSPWGTVDHCKMLCYGAFEVQTARHGGVMILRELADEFNMYDTYQSHEWAFDYANCQIVKVDPHQMLYPENVVMFDSHQVLEHAIEICKELIDEICPDGK